MRTGIIWILGAKGKGAVSSDTVQHGMRFEASSSRKKFCAFWFSEGPPQGEEQSINRVVMERKCTLDVCSATEDGKGRTVNCNKARLKKQWMCAKKEEKKSKRTNFPKKLAGLLKRINKQVQSSRNLSSQGFRILPSDTQVDCHELSSSMQSVQTHCEDSWACTHTQPQHKLRRTWKTPPPPQNKGPRLRWRNPQRLI